MKIVFNTNENRPVSIKKMNPVSLMTTFNVAQTNGETFDLAAYLKKVKLKMTVKQAGAEIEKFNGSMYEYLATAKAPYGFYMMDKGFNHSADGDSLMYRTNIPLLTIYNLDGTDELILEVENPKDAKADSNTITMIVQEGQGVQRFIPVIKKKLLQFSGTQRVSFAKSLKTLLITDRDLNVSSNYHADLLNSDLTIETDGFKTKTPVEVFGINLFEATGAQVGDDERTITALPVYNKALANDVSVEADWGNNVAFYSIHYSFLPSITNKANALTARIKNSAAAKTLT